MKRYRGSYTSYVITYFFYYFCMAVFGSILSVYLTGIGKTAPEMSFIVSASSFFSFFCLPIVGYLNDKLQRPRTICIILMIAVGGLGIAFAFSRSVPVLFLLNGLIMSGINGVMPITEKMAGAAKNFRYGSIRVWGTLGYAFGAQVAGFAIEKIAPSFIFVFLLIGAVITIFGLLGVENNPAEKGEDKPTEEDKKEKGIRIRDFLKDKNFILYLIIVFLFWGASGVNMTYIPVMLTEIGVGTTTVGTIIFLSTLVEIPIIIFSHKFMDRFTVKQLLGAAFLMTALQFVCYGFSSSTSLIILMIVLLKAIATTLFVMINLKTAMIIVGVRYTTTALSVINSVNAIGTIILQNLAGSFVAWFGISTMYIGLLVLIALAFVVSLFIKLENKEGIFS